MLQELLKFSDSWYSYYRGKTVSGIGNQQLRKYIYECLGLMDYPSNYHIEDIQYPEFTKRSSLEIYLPDWIFYADNWKIYLGEEEPPLHVVLGIINGMILDIRNMLLSGITSNLYSFYSRTNVLHCGWRKSSCDVEFDTWVQKISDDEWLQLMNIYGELWASSKTWEVQYKQDNFIHLYHIIVYSEELPEHPLSSKELYLRTLKSCVVPGNLEQLQYVLPEEYEAIYSEKRDELCYKLLYLYYKRFPQEEEEQQKESEEEESKAGQDEYNSSQEEEQPIETMFDQMEKPSQSETDDMQQEIAKVISPYHVEEDMVIPKVFHYVLNKNLCNTDVNKLRCFWGSSISSFDENLVDEKFGFLHRVLRVRTKNRTFGPPTDKGRKIVNTRLSRIATDSKIFSWDAQIDKWNPPEIILLCDWSGSMKWKYKNTYFRDYVLCIAYHMMKIINKVTEINLYLHTTTSKNGTNVPCDSPLLLEIDKIHLKDSLGMANMFGGNCNMDGVVLDYLYNIYNKKRTNKKKVFIVLSDGQPNGDMGSGYKNEAAVNHTKSIVQKMRKRGMAVIGMSLDSESDRRLQDIYGKKNFVKSGNIEKNLEKVLTEVLGEL